MKTNQEMVRYIDSFSVVQRTSDGYFDGTELLRQWNNVEGNPRRQMSKFLESDNTSEFLKALAEDESHRAKMLIGENQLLIKVKGRNTKGGKTLDKVWMNPLLFIKFAMWINPTFEVKVLRFVYDEMIKFRNLSGDAYPTMCKAVKSILPEDIFREKIQDLARSLNIIVYGKHESEMRNKIADESKLRELYELEMNIAQWINLGIVNNYQSLKKALTNLYYQKYPNVLPL